MRVTHQPSPWIGDYGHFIILPSMVDAASHPKDTFSSYNPHESDFTPYFFRTSLLSYGNSNGFTTLQFSPTTHGGIFRVEFPLYEPNKVLQTRRISLLLNGAPDEAHVVKCGTGKDECMMGTINIMGFTKKASKIQENSNFAAYFVIALFGGKNGDIRLNDTLSMESDANMVSLDFDGNIENHQYLTIRFATSFISLEQANINLLREVPLTKSFLDIKTDAKREWNKVLSRVNILSVGNKYSTRERDNLLTTFYSSLWRASLFPRQISEFDGDGKEVHWSPFDSEGRVFDGPLSTDSGFW
jgi:putative alpha-1,2-mannosidase